MKGKESTTSTERRRARDRQRVCRARRRAGRVPYTIVVNEVEVAEALMQTGRMSKKDVLDHKKVEKFLSSVVEQWAVRWLIK